MEHLDALTPLFDPGRVALIVESGEPADWISALQRQLGESKAAYSCFELPPDAHAPQADTSGQPFDLGIVAVSSERAADALRFAIALGARAVSMLSESPDAAFAAELARMAREAKVRLLGPATMGFARPSRRLNASRMGALPPPGNVALVSQSGVLGAAILDWAGDTAIGFSLAVSLGAEVDVDLAQVLDFLASDFSTKAVVVYLEAVCDSRSFMSALRGLASVKPVVVLKGGRDAAPRPASRTHSGAIVGGDAIYSAAFRRAGAVQVRLFTQLFTAVRYLASRNWPLGKRLAMVGNGNAPLVLASDQAWFGNIRLLPFTEPTLRRLGDALPGVTIANPLNLGVAADADSYASALEAIAYDPESDAMLALLTPFGGVAAAEITERIAAIAGTLGKPLFACWLGDNSVRPLRARLDAAGVPVFRTPEAAVDAFSTVAQFYQNQLLLQQTPRSLSAMVPPDVDAARALIERATGEGREVLTELESKELLAAFHVPVNATVLARDAAQAVTLCREIGYPAAMKVSSADVAHKSDVGGVVLNVRNASETREQFDAILAAVRNAQPTARIEGVTLQPMKLGRHGRELYVGVFRDRLFGPVIAFGIGGTRVEVLRDTTLEFPPLNRFLARSMIARTRVAQTLGEFRGSPAIDVDALEGLLVRVSEMVCELPQLVEVDINPIIADQGGLIAVDARIAVAPRAEQADRVDRRRYAHMAIMPYPSQLEQRCTLRDGRPYLVRPIQAEDGERLQRFVRSLSEQSRYFRFISTLNELSPRMLVRYTQIDYDRELALVAIREGAGTAPDAAAARTKAAVEAAVEAAADAAAAKIEAAGEATPEAAPDDQTIIGVVRYLLNPDRRSCEFAIAVADTFHGQGLGSTLMKAIVASARKKGLQRIEGFVLATNAPMLRLMQALDFSIGSDADDPSLKRVWLTLA